MSKISRRSFLKSSAVAALGGTALLGAGSFVGCAPEKSGSRKSDGAPSETMALNQLVVYDTDVVVIGSGVAGIQAASSAAASGAGVIVLDKKRFGHSGSSGLQTSGAMSSSEFEIEGDTPRIHLEDAVETGRYIVDQELGNDILQGYYDDRVLMMSENVGNLHTRVADTSAPVIGPSKGQSRRWIGYRNSNPARTAKAMGVQVKEYCTATKIFSDEKGAACGVAALDFKTGQFFVIRAKSVVIATGGPDALWGAADITGKYSGCASGLVGDGHALAAPLGVEFRDLEFRSHKGDGKLLFAVADMGIAGFPWLPGTSGPETWTDKDGTPVFPDITSETDLTMRQMAVEFYRLKNEGRLGPHGGIFGSIKLIKNEDMKGPNEHPYNQTQLSWEGNGAMPERVELIPVSVYDYGGIVTDANGSTKVEGLYACGECAMHTGAAYSSFRMFSSGMVLGKRIGQATAERAKQVTFSALNSNEVAEEQSRIEGFLTNEPSDPISVIEMRHKIQDAAWLGAGALRSDETCKAALEILDECESQVSQVRVDGKSRICNMNWAEAIEIPNMIKVSRMVILACQARTESRGTHMRAEYPLEDNDNWIKNVYLSEKSGELQVEIKDTVLGLVDVPSGTNDQGGDVIELDWKSWK